ncbi:MAG TPA: hypothetical protein PLU45_01415, partial [Bacteroidales bacterium]|nr:hypothetical protein [Bacteroidales bacterium]
MKGVPKKLREIADQYLISQGINQQVEPISIIADDFFSEDNFLEPAVMPDDKADNYTPDKALYEELKKSGLNGF